MARGIHKLTPDRAWKLSRKPGLYGDGGGLYLRVTPPSASSWVFRYMIDGVAQGMGLGPYPDVDLDTARGKAAEARRLKASGVNPLKQRESVRAAQRISEAKAITFRECATAYIDQRKTGKKRWKKDKQVGEWTATLNDYAMPLLGDLPVAAIDRNLIIRVLEPIWSTKHETARKVRGRVEAILDWAAAKEYRDGDNPARWKGPLGELLGIQGPEKAAQRHAMLPYAELPDFMEALRAQPGDAAQALQLVILNGSRTSEVIEMPFAEVDLDAGLWTIPGARMKSGREHRVPLTAPALHILRDRHKALKGFGHVFPGRAEGRPLSNMAMLKLLERMERSDLTVHGFRATFRTWAAECTSFPREVAEVALSHAVGSDLEQRYQRGDLFEKRRKLMDAWARYCTTPAAKGAVKGRVVQIRGGT